MGEPIIHQSGGRSGRRFSVLALHGFPGTPDDWRALQAQSSGAWLTPNMPWLYTTDRHLPNAPLTLRNVVEQVLSFTHAQTQLPIHLVGHDLGGAIAWWIAAMFPQVVVSLTVISAPHPQVYADARPQLQADGRLAYLHDLVTDSGDAPLKPEPLLAALQRETEATSQVLHGLAQSNPAAVRSLYQNTLTDAALAGTAHFPDLVLPLFYFQGQNDPYFPSDLCDATLRASGSLASSKLVSGAGHFPQLTHATDMAKTLDAFWVYAESVMGV